MARLGTVLALFRALGKISWRDIQTFRSIGGQNLFLFIALLALQPESAEFFLLILAAVILFPLSADPMQKVPADRRMGWPLARWEWSLVRAGSLALSPVAWLGIALLVRAGWRSAALVVMTGACLQLVAAALRRLPGRLSARWLRAIPTLAGVTGMLVGLHWREMLRTLDPYVAFTLMAATELYRVSGNPLDPGAGQIIALIVALAVSTQTQVLLAIDGRGAERYRQIPIRGWRILLAKDLAFLILVGLLVAPLDFVSGITGSLAALAIGHHRSVMKPVPQVLWRFTSGMLFPDGAVQVVALFAVGMAARRIPLLIAASLVAWIGSVAIYGWRWDRQAS